MLSQFLGILLVNSCIAQLPPFLTQSTEGYGISLGSWQQAKPVDAQIFTSARSMQEISSAYTSWNGATQTASATLSTSAGTRLVFQDAFSSEPNGFKVARTVQVQSKGTGESAFSTMFTMQAGRQAGIADYNFFMPGVWYNDGRNVPLPWFGTDPNVQYVLVREDRTAYPLITAYDPTTSSWSSLLHLSPNGSTVINDNSNLNAIVDANLQYGSIGVVNKGNLQLAFAFPGSEGNTTRGGGVTRPNRWVHRNHPLTVGFSQSYEVAFIQGGNDSFADAVQDSWRYAFDSANPQPPKVNRTVVFTESIGLLGEFVQKYNGIPSVPFTINVTDGTVLDTSSQSGFTGKATLASAFMIAAHMGQTTVQLQQTNTTVLNNAIDVIDTWVNRSMTRFGVPRTWYNTGSGSVGWRVASIYMGHIRVISDGLQGVLTAWRLIGKPSWLQYCQTVGNFFVQNQAADGSFAGAWNYSDGTALAQYQNTTYFVIPFLLDLYNATANESYRQCALKAGEYSYNNVHKQYMYAGGAADNPNVRDKESGVLAFNAFLALYEAVGDSKWLTAAMQAGTYCETFVYIWAVPQFTGSGYLSLPAPRTVMGMSLVATGRSAADNYMSACVHLYKRLYDYTCDAHFLQFSQFLEDATAQPINWDGQLGYARRGLMPEAISIVDRGNMAKAGGTDVWLPWLTVCALEPFMATSVVRSSCPSTTTRATTSRRVTTTITSRRVTTTKRSKDDNDTLVSIVTSVASRYFSSTYLWVAVSLIAVMMIS